MGELHLEIITERLRSEFKVETFLGTLRVAYRESITVAVEQVHTYDVEQAGKRHFAQVAVRLEPFLQDDKSSDIQKSTFVQWIENPKQGTNKCPPLFQKAILDAIQFSLFRGPCGGYKCTNLKVYIDEEKCAWDSCSSIAAFRACTAHAFQKVI